MIQTLLDFISRLISPRPSPDEHEADGVTHTPTLPTPLPPVKVEEPPVLVTDQLTPNFHLREFTRSATALAHGLDNTPTTAHRENLLRLAKTLESVRLLLAHPILISSGYRSAQLNQLVGGSATSDHALGLAADFTCPGYGSVEDVCRAIADSSIPFDQLIFEQGGTHWVHLGIGARMRRQTLSWSPKTKYVNGIRRLS